MTLTNEDVRQILSIIEASSFDSIEIRIGDMSLAASKSGPLVAQQAAPPVLASAPQPAAEPAPAAPVSAPHQKTEDLHEDGLVEIKAPIVGIFYVAPEPGAAPFVEEGDRIDADTTVGIIEVMKVFNSIRAETSGTVVRRLVEDGAFVEFHQPILLIRPEA